MRSSSTLLPIRKLDSVTFDTFLKQQKTFQSANCTFDLTGVRFVAPSVLVQLAAACYGLARDGRRPTIIVDDNGLRRYLMRVGFIQVVQPIAQFLPRISAMLARVYDDLRGSNSMLIEVTKIQQGAELPSLLDRIIHVLCHRLKYKKNDAFDVAVAVSEICQNTFDHNVHTCGFLAMQVYRSGSGRFLEIGVADYGDGLAATLRRNPDNSPIASDKEAIYQATQLGTSAFRDHTRGTGLYRLLEITYKHRGSVQIRSGAAIVRFRMDKQRGWNFPVPSMPGVQVAFTLPTKLGA